MKIRAHVLLLASAAIAASLASGCSSDRAGAPTSAPEAPRAAAPTAREAVASAALVIDVRTKEEFDGGHLAKAENIPVDEVEAQVAAIAERVGGDKTKPIAVYCASGGRAGRAKSMLEKAGFTQVTNAGGYRDLKD